MPKIREMMASYNKIAMGANVNTAAAKTGSSAVKGQTVCPLCTSRSDGAPTSNPAHKRKKASY